jgi:hypothetical protein
MKKPTPLEPRPHPPDQPIRRCLCFAPRRPVRSLHNSHHSAAASRPKPIIIYTTAVLNQTEAPPRRGRGRRPKTIYSFLKQNKTKQNPGKPGTGFLLPVFISLFPGSGCRSRCFFPRRRCLNGELERRGCGILILLTLVRIGGEGNNWEGDRWESVIFGH